MMATSGRAWGSTVTVPSKTKSTTVTLTNWKRVANVPHSADGSVQAVQWRDYVVFLDKKGEMYLYHYKCGIWSSLQSKNAYSAAGGCPLAVFNRDLILVSSSCDIFKFIVETGHWKVCDTLKIDDKKRLLPISRAQQSTFSHRAGAGIIRSTSDADSVVLVSTLDRMSLYLLIQNEQREVYLKTFHDSKWSKSLKLQTGFLSSQASYALLLPHLYVSTNSGIYCIDTEQCVEKLMVASIPSPPSLAMSTICGVGDTMFSFGGKDEDGQPSSDIFRYNPATNEWEPAGYMRSSRYSITISSFLKDEENTDIIAVGGIFGEDTDKQPPTVLKSRIAEVCEVGFFCN